MTHLTISYTTRIIFIVLLFFPTLTNALQLENFSHEREICISGVYSNNTFLEKSATFYAFDNVYLKFECSNLTPGNYNLNLEWINPKGILQKNSSHSFIIDSNQNYVMHFSFRLNQNGVFSQIFTGEEFAEEQYGKWKVISYLDNHRIGENQFHIVK
jgi:hypothetical protein